MRVSSKQLEWEWRRQGKSDSRFNWLSIALGLWLAREQEPEQFELSWEHLNRLPNVSRKLFNISKANNRSSPLVRCLFHGKLIPISEQQTLSQNSSYRILTCLFLYLKQEGQTIANSGARYGQSVHVGYLHRHIWRLDNSCRQRGYC